MITNMMITAQDCKVNCILNEIMLTLIDRS